jgi:hypothetical protein
VNCGRREREGPEQKAWLDEPSTDAREGGWRGRRWWRRGEAPGHSFWFMAASFMVSWRCLGEFKFEFMLLGSWKSRDKRGGRQDFESRNKREVAGLLKAAKSNKKNKNKNKRIRKKNKIK